MLFFKRKSSWLKLKNTIIIIVIIIIVIIIIIIIINYYYHHYYFDKPQVLNINKFINTKFKC